MSLTTKAIFAALALSLTPAMASAQSFNYQIAPSNGTPYINGVSPNAGGPQPVPVREQTCGANRLQAFVGHNVETLRGSGMPARYFTPDNPFGTMDYLADRLNVITDANYIISRVYCG